MLSPDERKALDKLPSFPEPRPSHLKSGMVTAARLGGLAG